MKTKQTQVRRGNYIPPGEVLGAPRYLDCWQVAEVLGVDIMWVRDRAATLAGIKVGRSWRFPIDRLPGQQNESESESDR